jgi:hypothetical protein
MFICKYCCVLECSAAYNLSVNITFSEVYIYMCVCMCIYIYCYRYKEKYVCSLYKNSSATQPVDFLMTIPESSCFRKKLVYDESSFMKLGKN